MDRTEVAGLLERRLALRHLHRASLTKHASAIALLAFLLFNCLFTNNFVAWETFSNIFTQATKVALVGLGLTLVIATGGIDISVGSAMGLGATIAAISLVSGNFAGVALSFVVVLAFGLLAGILTSRFSILPLVSTLASAYIMRGLARGISGRGTVTYNNPGGDQLLHYADRRPLACPVFRPVDLRRRDVSGREQNEVRFRCGGLWQQSRCR
jgi:ribose/xylose/arabinose/galactoside ABC-type transport system permease subunit